MARNILIYILPMILIGTVTSLSFLSSAEFNPLSISHDESKLVFTVIPQGWGFFTRDPREAQTLIYKQVNNTYELINKSGGEPEYLFGLSRISRKKNIEFGQIFSQIPDSLWIECPAKDIQTCNTKVVKAHHFKNSFSNPLSKGEFVLVTQDPVPWAWSKSYYVIKMPFKFCKIYVD